MKKFRDWDYSITPDGRVYSHKTNKYLTLTKKSGYHTVKLRHDGNSHYKRVHRLVAEIFIPNPSAVSIPNHKNNDGYDNRVENLEWLTHKENSQHCVDNGFRTFYKRPVLQLRLRKKCQEVSRYKSIQGAARESGIDKGIIWNSCKNENFTSRKYPNLKWRFADPDNVVHGQPSTVIQYESCYKIVKRHESVTDAAKHVCTNHDNIIHACNREHGTSMGFCWKYETKNEDVSDIVKDWMPIPEFTRYLISKNGQIYSTMRKKILKWQHDRDCYVIIGLTNDKKEKKNSLGVHILVAKTYLPNTDHLPEVNHIDGNKDNNCVDNLEWITKSDNCQHAHDTGLNKISRPVNKYTFEGEFIQRYKSVKEAAKENDIYTKSIIRSCKKKRAFKTGDRYFYDGEEELDFEFLNWKPLPTNPNFLVSDNGRVYSKSRDRLLKQTLNYNKYSTGLPEGSRETHLLVAEAYLPNPKNYKYVVHKNGDKLDNRVENLERANKITCKKGSRLFTGIRPVERIGENDDRQIYLSIKMAAQDMDVNPSSIIRVCQGVKKSCRGYRWEYKD